MVTAAKYRVKMLCSAALIGLTLASATAGCSRLTDQQGYLSDPVLTKNIMPKVDNRQSVIGTLGQPSIAGTFDESVYYYVTRQTEQFAFFTPDPTEHTVMAIYFDDKDNVDRVEYFGLDDIKKVRYADDKTPTRGREMGFLEQLFGNIGRFSGAPGGPGGGGPGGPPP
ncbi:MAG: outer membrane protein assembly factor BamE [Pseudomonadota bacterium]